MDYNNYNNHNNPEGRELGWDDSISNDESEFQPIPEGDYTFTVTKFERGRSKGSNKLPACNMAMLTLRIEGGGRTVTITDNLVLHSSLEWKLSAFFRSIGQKKHGERLCPRWNEVVGARGRCRVYIDNYTDKEGRPRQNNKIDKYLDPDNTAPTTNTAASAASAQRYW